MSKKELIKKWCDALESGKYIQGTEVLRKKENNIEKYCCLGVLCDILEPSKWSVIATNFIHYENSGLPIPSIIEKIGLTIQDSYKLVDMNDSGDYTFKDISNYIKDNFLNDSTESN